MLNQVGHLLPSIKFIIIKVAIDKILRPCTVANSLTSGRRYSKNIHQQFAILVFVLTVRRLISYSKRDSLRKMEVGMWAAWAAGVLCCQCVGSLSIFRCQIDASLFTMVLPGTSSNKDSLYHSELLVII